RAEVVKRPEMGRLDQYEGLFFESLENDGRLSQDELQALMNLAVKNIQNKAWDADIEATKAYYQQMMDQWMA
ncbi:MAG: hypothetical protein KDG51_00345, partial [Calditrichaeota bacterium]|nr:hypothetical protein [Calditrichota bacterium]